MVDARALRWSKLQPLVIADGFEELLPSADPILAGVHRRWVEHELAQASAYVAEQSGLATTMGAAQVALLFVDIKGFTAFVARTLNV